MKHAFVRCIVPLAFVLLFSSCFIRQDNPLLDCSEVADTRLASFPFREVTIETALLWIQNQYSVQENDLRIEYRPPGTEPEYWEWEIVWQADNRDYGLAFLLRGIPDAMLYVRWRSQAPTISDALRCLGQPSSYRAFYDKYPEATWTALELWYPERGFKFATRIPRKLSRFDENVVLGIAYYALPGSVEEFLLHHSTVVQGSAAYTQTLTTIRPWPGNIKDITIAQQE